MKKLSLTILCLILALGSFSSVAFAETGDRVKATGTIVDLPNHISVLPTPRSMLPEAYEVRNKNPEGYEPLTIRQMTTVWAKSDGYTVNSGQSTTYSLQSGISANVKGFSLSGSFTVSKQYTQSVSTHIPANASKLSRLELKCNYNKYKADLYYLPVRQETSIITWKYLGRDTVYEPTNDVFYEVVYK